MAIQQIRHEVYDDKGLVEVFYEDIDIKTDEEILQEKQDELIRIYSEIQELMNKKTN